MKTHISRKDAALVYLATLDYALQIMTPKAKDYTGVVTNGDPYSNFRQGEALLSSIGPAHPVHTALIHITKKMSRCSSVAAQVAGGACETGLNGSVGENVIANDVPDLVNYAGIIAGLFAESLDEKDLETLRKRGKSIISTIVKFAEVNDISLVTEHKDKGD